MFGPFVQYRSKKARLQPVWLAFVLLVAGCSGEYSGNASTGGNLTVEGACGTEVTMGGFGSTALNTKGQQHYQQQCQTCHGIQGEGTANGPSLVSCATCTDIDTLADRIATTMPIPNVEECGLQCANDTAEYILSAFTSQVMEDVSGVLDGVGRMTAKETLYKASLSLGGRLPTQSEIDAVTNTGDAGLDQALDVLLAEEAFYSRLMEIYNDLLHQDKYLPNEDALNLLDNNDYSHRKWYNELGLDTSQAGPERDLRDWLRDQTNDAVARETLQLIAHVVRNERPFTEILTADYTLVNRYSAEVYNVAGGLQFKSATNPRFDTFPEDPNDFKEVRVANIPHAGVLTSSMFLNRFPTTDTNRNRHRARMVFDMFLDTDLLAIPGSRPEDAVDLSSTAPTLDNPSCVSCHAVMDPVASTFQNWDERGRYRRSRLNDGWYSDMHYSGINGKTMPLSGNIDAQLRWLGKEIAKDTRFARATVKTLFRGLTGQEPIPAPASTVEQCAPDRQSYLAQRTHLGRVERAFIDANYNLKVAVKEIVKGPYYRARSVAGHSELHAATGSARLLTPEMLDRKISAVTGYDWKRGSWASRSELHKENRGGYNQLYGGIDSDNVTKRITQPNGLMAAVQLRMANEMACYALPRDFYKPQSQRLLFPLVTAAMAPRDATGADIPANQSAIRENIRYLHWRLFGRDVSSSDPAVTAAYNLYLDVWQTGMASIPADKPWINGYLPGHCSLKNDPVTDANLTEEARIHEDKKYVLRAWMAVLAYLLSDYEFLYE